MSFGTTCQGPVGLLPAAGRGSRFGTAGYGYGYIKELFPLLPAGEDEPARPICEWALRMICAAGAERCAVVLSPRKLDVIKVLAQSEHLGISLSYIVQPEPRGLPHAVRCARPWLESRDVLLALPDTIVLPADALAEVQKERLQSGADVVLGLFPTQEPERLGPVEFSADGAVLRVHDKPALSPVANSWGVASWSSRFTDFCTAWDAQQEQSAVTERVLGHAFEAARQAGLRLRARFFAMGAMLDIGTPRGLRAALRKLAAAGEIGSDQIQIANADAPAGRNRP